jgi:Uma2 family endonuclease
MVAHAAPRTTYAEYLTHEAASEVRHEYVAGQIVAMAGGAIEHGRLIARVQLELHRALAGRPCAVLASDVRVRIRAADRATYPDVLVVCGEVQRDPDDDHAIINPTVIVEVLSDSTTSTDRESKGPDHRRLPSLAEYVLVSQRARRVEVYRRSGPRQWTVEEVVAGERLALTSLTVELAVDALYEDGLGAIVP